MNVIEARGLTKAYRGKRVVDRLDMRVAQGDIYGFVGKNGAGKSTVMKMICGLVTPTEGEVELFGGAQAGGAGGAICTGRIGALALVGLGETGKKKARGFSLGMKQRLGLALALIGSPDLLLLDEPLNGLDPEGTRAMRNLIVRLNQSFGVTIVISSHVLDQLDRMATRFGVIANGRMVREMTADEVQAECGDSLRVRTADPARTLALLEEALPGAAFRAEPDGALSVSGAVNQAAVAQVLRASDQTVLELSQVKRDIEDYFVELMEGGARVQTEAAARGKGGARHV